MATEPYRHPGFGAGLSIAVSEGDGTTNAFTGESVIAGGTPDDWVASAIENGEAQIAGLNVTSYGLQGGVRSRPGTVWTGGSSGGLADHEGAVYRGWEYSLVSPKYVVAAMVSPALSGLGSPAKGLEVWGNSTSPVFAVNTSSKWTTNGIATDAVTWRAASGTRTMYIVNGNDCFTYNGSSITDYLASMTGLPVAGRFVAVAPWSPRMVMARLGSTGAGQNISTIRFSQPDNPSSWGASDFVDLILNAESKWTGYMNEQIMGLFSWTDYLFVLTTDRVFAFTGESTDSDGSTEFLYREVCQGRFQGGHVTPDGLMLYGPDGVWMTNGGPAVELSAEINGLFTGGSLTWPPAVAQAGTITPYGDPIHGVHHDGSDYIPLYGNSANLRKRLTLVREPGNRWQLWSGDNIEWFTVGTAVGLAGFRGFVQEDTLTNSQFRRSMFSYKEGALTDESDLAADDNLPVDSWYHSGWMTLSSTDVKSIRELKITGRGTAKVEVAIDHELVTDPGVEVVFDTTTTRRFEIKTVRGRGATVRGTYLAIALRSVAGAPFHVKDVTYMLRATRTHGIPKVDR